MGRPKRRDEPGDWHHVMNRGIAQRPLFEGTRDARAFLARLVKQVRLGRIEIHAWCLMVNHYHLLVRSPVGELSEAMRCAQNGYSRWFNRSHDRDGPLFRGRFASYLVETKRYRETLLRYIDDNPVEGGIVRHPCDYRWGSARQFAQPRRPLWLDRSVVEPHVHSLYEEAPCASAAYVKFASRRLSSGARAVVETRTASVDAGEDGLDQLYGAAPERVRAWMQRTAKKADGLRVGVAVCDTVSIQAAVRSARHEGGRWTVASSRQVLDCWRMLEALLLRTMTGTTLAAVADALGCSPSGAARWIDRGRQAALSGDPTFAERAAEVGADALARCHGCQGTFQ